MLLRETHSDMASYTFALFAPQPRTRVYEYIPFGTSSTQELDLSSQVTILPNPVDDYISIRSEAQFTQARLSLYDVAGRLHKQMDITSDTRVDMTSMDAGVYIYQLRWDGKVATGKVVKE